MNWHTALFFLPGLIIGITAHEFAHAVTAKWLGDRNPERMGRVSLNPFRHLSVWGTLALFVLGFGWGKPVEINLYNFKKPKFYFLLSSLAGPASNLFLCAVSLGVLYLNPHRIVVFVCMSIFLVNAILAVVNLLPIPPLDGSRIWPCIIPRMRLAESTKWRKIWMVVLLLCIFSRVIDRILGPVIGFLFSFMPHYS